jgi:DUF1680 family protein
MATFPMQGRPPYAAEKGLVHVGSAATSLGKFVHVIRACSIDQSQTATRLPALLSNLVTTGLVIGQLVVTIRLTNRSWMATTNWLFQVT